METVSTGFKTQKYRKVIEASEKLTVLRLMDDLQEKVIAENGKFNGERKVDKCNVDLKGCNF